MIIAPGKVEALTNSLIALGFGYGMDYKIDPLSQQAPNIKGRNKQTGETGKRVDCSGFVRWCLFHATGMTIPDGSVQQHVWAEKPGLPNCAFDDCLNVDGVVRIAFLPPEASGEGVGHVMLVRNGRTYESHGGVGPGTRVWGSCSFMSKCKVYALT
jgi:cell wall-associated NlpC family hydrolase